MVLPQAADARRRDIPGKATVIMAALRGAQLGQPPTITAAYRPPSGP